MKHPSSSKYDYSVDNQISPWYKRLWCYLIHSKAPTAYNPQTKMFRCMRCDNRWKN